MSVWLRFVTMIVLMAGLSLGPAMAIEARKPRATLILSFQEDRRQLVWAWGGRKWVIYQPQESLHQELARRFSEFFRNTQWETRVYYQGQEEDLYREGQDPDNEFVVWLSHSGKSANVAEPSVVVDIKGHDIAPLLQKTHWNAKNLVILGCDNDFLQVNWAANHPDTKLWISGPRLLVRPIYQMIEILKQIVAAYQGFPRK